MHSISGSPEERIDKIENLEASGLTHLSILVTDAQLVQHLTHIKTRGIPRYEEVINLVNKKIMPHFQQHT